MCPQPNRQRSSKLKGKGKANNSNKSVQGGGNTKLRMPKKALTPAETAARVQEYQQNTCDKLRKFIENGLHVVKSQALKDHDLEDIKLLFLGGQQLQLTESNQGLASQAGGLATRGTAFVASES